MKALHYASTEDVSPCHPERSEGSVALGVEMLRGVYNEHSECAQHDRAVTYKNAWIKVFMCMIAPSADSSSPVGLSAIQMKQLICINFP
jgi:hypothetical protein